MYKFWPHRENRLLTFIVEDRLSDRELDNTVGGSLAWGLELHGVMLGASGIRE